jgi:hypothetical protein
LFVLLQQFLARTFAKRLDTVVNVLQVSVMCAGCVRRQRT